MIAIARRREGLTASRQKKGSPGRAIFRKRERERKLTHHVFVISGEIPIGLDDDGAQLHIIRVSAFLKQRGEELMVTSQSHVFKGEGKLLTFSFLFTRVSNNPQHLLLRTLSFLCKTRYS